MRIYRRYAHFCSIISWIFLPNIIAFSSRMNMNTNNDLYIVGAGYLGRIIGKKWKSLHPDAEVHGETRSLSKHEELASLGIVSHLRENRESVKFPNVVFSASPSGNENYAEEVELAAKTLWDATKTGCFIFTSSGGIYAENNGGVVTEVSPVGESSRNKKLIEAEALALEAGGCVIRLAGLYSLERGPHSFWLARGKVEADKDGWINLVSYDDAADAVVAAIEYSGRALTLLAADQRNPPMTRYEICEKATQHPMYKSQSMPEFAALQGSELGKGKVYNCSATCRILQWEPKHKSFGDYIDEAVRQCEK